MNLMTHCRRASAWLLAALLAAVLSACGGGGGGDNPAPVTPTPPVVVEKPATRAEAARFVTQATFGPTDTDIDRVMAIGYAPWIDEQFALPATSHRSYFDGRDAEIKAANATSSAGQDQVFETFWKQALTGPDQLRQRSVFALSQIFVISMADDAVANTPRAVAAWLDMLGSDGLSTYRQALESVSRHPMMGLYLSHLRNQKADARTGRVPDENYAREVMQLFSIGTSSSTRMAAREPRPAAPPTPTRRPTSRAWRACSRAGAGPAPTGRTTAASHPASTTASPTPTAASNLCWATRSTTAPKRSVSWAW